MANHSMRGARERSWLAHNWNGSSRALAKCFSIRASVFFILAAPVFLPVPNRCSLNGAQSILNMTT
jgi:hypothetical protein